MYAVTSPPAAEPVTLDAVKAHLRINPGDTSEDTEILEPLISAAREYCELRTGRALAVETLSADLPAGRQYLPRPPILEILSVQDGDGDVSYTANLAHGWVYLDRAATVTYRCGYETLPLSLRQAMLLLIGHWYTNREAVVVGAFASVEIAETVHSLLDLYKVWWF